MSAWWAENASAFFAGAGALTALGAVAVWLSRQPVQRQRLAESTVCIVFVWLALAMVPRTVPEVTKIAPSGVLELVGVPEDWVVVESAASEEAATDWTAVLGVAFSLGAISCALYLAVAWSLLRCVLRNARLAPESICTLSQKLPLAPRRARLVISEAVSRPFCCGIVRPHIVIPAASQDTDLRSVLLHEHAHLAHHDLRGQALFALALPLLYWNPLFWWLRRESRLAAELVADDVAARHVDKASYVRDLCDFAESNPRSERHVAALAVLGHESEFFRRMKMLIQRQDRLTTRCSRVHTCARRLAGTALAIVAGFAWSAPDAWAQSAPLPAPSKSAGAPKATPQKGPKATLRLHVDLQFDSRADLGVLLTDVVTKGLQIEGLKVQEPKKGSKSQSAKLVVTATNQEVAIRHLQSAANQSVRLLSVRAKSLPKPVAAPLPKATPKPASPVLPPKPALPRKDLVAMEFDNTDIAEVIASCAKAGSMNIVTAPEVQGTITMRVAGVPARKVLEAAVETLGYVVTEDSSGILRITTSQGAPKK